MSATPTYLPTWTQGKAVSTDGFAAEYTGGPRVKLHWCACYERQIRSVTIAGTLPGGIGQYSQST